MGRRRRSRRQARPPPPSARRTTCRSAPPRRPTPPSPGRRARRGGPPGHDPVDVAPAVHVLEAGTRAAADEHGLVEPDRPHGAHRRVDAARDERPRPPPQLRPRLRRPAQRCGASSFAQYVTTTSAPARLIAVSDSSAAWRSSSHPPAAAAFTIAYSPETL